MTALRYSEMNGRGPDSGTCNPAMVTADYANVAPPGDGAGAHVPVVDRSCRPAQVTVCGDEVRMSPPVGR